MGYVVLLLLFGHDSRSFTHACCSSSSSLLSSCSPHGPTISPWSRWTMIAHGVCSLSVFLFGLGPFALYYGAVFILYVHNFLERRERLPSPSLDLSCSRAA